MQINLWGPDVLVWPGFVGWEFDWMMRIVVDVEVGVKLITTNACVRLISEVRYSIFGNVGVIDMRIERLCIRNFSDSFKVHPSAH